MRIPSVSTLVSTFLSFTSVASTSNQRGSHSASTVVVPQDTHSFPQANGHTADNTNFLRREKNVSHYITPQNNDDGSPTVSTNAELCQYSSAYQCVGSTVTYGTNSSADLAGYVFSGNSGVNIYQDDIDRFAREFAEAAIPNAKNDVNSTSATLAAYSQQGEHVASVVTYDPDMQLGQLKAVRPLLKNLAAPDGRVLIIVENNVINDDGYSQGNDDNSYNNNDDDYSPSYPITNDPLMVYLAAAGGALVAESIAICVLAVLLYHSCRRESAMTMAMAVAGNDNTLEVVANDASNHTTHIADEETGLTDSVRLEDNLQTIPLEIHSNDAGNDEPVSFCAIS